jgi:transposase
MPPQDSLIQLLNTRLEQNLQLQRINACQAESLKKLTEQGEQQQAKINELLSRIAWLNRQLFGRKSEKPAHLDPNQLPLFEDISTIKQTEEEIASAREAAIEEIEAETVHKKKERCKRKVLENLPVIEMLIEPEDPDLEKYKRIGEERTRSLEFEPGRLYVKEIIRPKYGLKDNTILPEEGKNTVVIASLPLLPIHKGLPGASMLAEILLQKYEYHVPFYRQVRSFRHLGLHISETALNGWFKPACGLLRPLYEELKKEVLSSDYVQVDETPLPVIDKESHQAKKEYLWVARSVMNRQVFFHYDDGSRSGKTAGNLLKTFKGYLQSDGYSAYNVFEGKEDVCLVACMSHIRRSFEKALDENKSLAEFALKEIRRLYQIERMADEKDMKDDERKALREKLAVPILNSLEKWIENTCPLVLPKSRTGQAVAYSYSLWPGMKNYLKEGRLKTDNNPAENVIRPIALSRKNFLFCGNHESAENTAVICSLLSSCKELEVNPREWLNDVLAKLPYYTRPGAEKDIKELLPKYWKEGKSNKIQ